MTHLHALGFYIVLHNSFFRVARIGRAIMRMTSIKLPGLVNLLPLSEGRRLEILLVNPQAFTEHLLCTQKQPCWKQELCPFFIAELPFSQCLGYSINAYWWTLTLYMITGDCFSIPKFSIMILNAGVKSYQADIFESFLEPATQAVIYGIEWDLFKEIFFLLQIIKYNRTHLEMLSVGAQNLNLSSLIKIHFVDTYIKHLKLFLNSSFWNTIRLSETHQFKKNHSCWKMLVRRANQNYWRMKYRLRLSVGARGQKTSFNLPLLMSFTASFSNLPFILF